MAKVKLVYGISETISLGNYQSIKPTWEENMEYDTDNIPEDVTEEQIKTNFIESVRQEYFKRRDQQLLDFIEFANRISKVNIPVRR